MKINADRTVLVVTRRKTDTVAAGQINLHKPLTAIKCFVLMLIFSIAIFGQQNPIQIDANGLTQTLTAGGVVTRGQIVKINSAGQVVPVLTTDTSGAIGVAATSQTSAGNGVAVSVQGTPLVQIDSGGCAAGNFVGFSTTTGGAGHCSSTAGTTQIGIALSISSPGSNFWNVALTVGGGGGGGIPGQFSVKTYGAVGDAKSTRDCVTTNLSSTFTSVSNPWLASDVGKFIYNSQGYGNPPFAPQKITGFNSAGSITVANASGGTATGTCVWFTQKEDTAFANAQAAAAAVLTSIDPQQNSPTLAYPGTVSCPPGGYVVSTQVINQNAPAGNTNAINFQGPGIGKCILYLSPDISTSGPALLMYWANTLNLDLAGFTVEGSGMVFNTSGPLIRINASANSHLHDFKVGEVNFTNFAVPVVQIQSTGSLGGTYLEHNHITASGCLTCALVEVDSTSSITFASNYVANGAGPNLLFNGCGTRAPQGGQCNWIGGYIDECSVNVTQGCTVITGNSVVNFFGTTMLGEPTAANSGAVFIDAGATAYINDTNIGAFSSTNNSNGLQIQSTGAAIVGGSTIRGNGTGAAIHGQSSTASYVDTGGNTLQNCSILVCNAITGSNFATLGFAGGLVPNTSLTHTYPQPFLSALPASGTAQNIVAFTPATSILVRNFSITASNTPTCATPPTFQISNGTQSFTQTFASSAQISGPFTPALTLFPAGTQVTLSITTAAYACATAPTNMNWSIEWEAANNQ